MGNSTPRNGRATDVEGALLSTALSAEFAPANAIIIVLTIPVLFVGGMSLWLWPLIIFYGDAPICDAERRRNIGQYALGIGFFLVGNNGPIWFAVGYAASYAILYGLLGLEFGRKRDSLVPSPPRIGNLVANR